MIARRLESLLQLGVFALFLALPLLDSGLDLDGSTTPRGSVTVTRQPERPSDLAALAGFPETFEPYFREHFGWRKWLIHRFHQLNYLAFRVSESPSVHVGRDDWFYYGKGAATFQRANVPFSDRERRRWFGSIRNRQEWLASQDIEYLFAVAPNKHSIYPEHLPAKLIRSGEETRWQLLSRLLGLHTEVKVVDLHAPLLAAKEHEQVYERTGSHWNQRGAYVAYRAIFDQLVERFPDLEPVEWDDVEWEDREGAADLVSMISAGGFVEERRQRPASGLRHLDLAFRRNGDLITEQDDPSLPRAVIFHDSFSVALAPFLAEHFSYAVFRWRPRFDGRLVQRVGADVVIEQRVERRLELGSIPNTLPKLSESP